MGGAWSRGNQGLEVGTPAQPCAPTDGFALGRAPLAPPYAVVLISCSGLLAFIFLLLTCLCCKRGDVGFKEFENPEGEDCSGEYTPPAEETSSSQSLPDVYILPLAEVSLPMPAPQPSHSDMTTPLGLSRQHLSYLQEIGSGWFGKVILGEVFSDYTPAQVVVKELRASAGPLEQRKFISEAQPYRSLQHPNVLQCLGVCVETLPFLLIMEFCQLGDLKRYLRAQRPPEGLSPELPSLGVTLWELFEFGAQPYRHLSDEEVLAFVVRQQHVKLARPRLKLPYGDYWYDILQSSLPGAREKPTFVVQVSTEQLLMSLREDVTRNVLGEKATAARDSGPRRAGRGPGSQERAPGPSGDPTAPGSGKKASSPNEEPSLPVNGVTVLENGGQAAPGIQEKVAENGGPEFPEREETVLENGELTPPRREETVLENGELRSPEREETVLVNGGPTPPKMEETVSENGGPRLPRNTERLPETGPWRAPGPWEKKPESGGPAPTIGEPAPETLLARAPAPGTVALPQNGGETAPGPPGPAPRSVELELGTKRNSRAGGDPAPSGDGDPPKPERKGPEMPRLFLDLGPPQGNSEQIKAKLSRLSLALPGIPASGRDQGESVERGAGAWAMGAEPRAFGAGLAHQPRVRLRGWLGMDLTREERVLERLRETPTNELSVQGPPEGDTDPSTPPAPPTPSEGLTSSSALPLHPLPPGGSFEWAEDFPLLPPPGPPLCFSRFSVSPALETPGPPTRAPDARPAGPVEN
ncbi:PREDICTED: serine/threonine-protein kinase LMTK3 [Myotis brandtii]|uniref:serine/threonine-protein kinase LMTK3 n=1 Tax=Myotis brandtii TaxID=109478 RepID=UPI0007041145|nr:PREDICTED: serine/threonine-protein kinase LMTK3 [Myotis brandtii]